jgi:hypothetical protein
MLSDPASQTLSVTELLADGFNQNTWTGILLTNLGLAERYQSGTIRYLYGQTYLDYLLSLPPGFLTYAIGYQRPLEATQGPNWWFMGLSGGGIHPVVVPFMNFGIAGCFIVMGIYGYFIAWCEKPSAGNWRRYLYGILVVHLVLVW